MWTLYSPGAALHAMTSDSPADAASDPWALLGLLLADYQDGREDAQAAVVWEDGSRTRLLASVFFRGLEAFSGAEAAAVELCRGHVLDAGAGAGCHALALQERGIAVRALDVCPRAVEVMRRRGVDDARVGDVFAAAEDAEIGDAYDTVVMLMNGVGLVGDLAGLDRFFGVAGRLVAPRGQILLDSADLRVTEDVGELRRLVRRVKEGRYRGETRQRIEYRGEQGATLAWLYVDSRTLRHRARRHGWMSQVVYEDGDGTYLARLVRSA